LFASLALSTGEGQALIGAEFGAKSCLLQSLHRLLAATGLVVVFSRNTLPPSSTKCTSVCGSRPQRSRMAWGMVIWPLLVTRIGA
jgi:ABC-type phosphate/phosphonate transport system ATPase subunit